MWKREVEVIVLRETGTQNLGEYIDRHQNTVSEWVMLRPIYKVCDKYMGYNRGGRRCEPWWRKTAPME